jgi:flagellar M-ring protein FliF
MTDQFQLLLRQLTIPQRLGIAVAALASVLLLVGFAMWAGKPDMKPAFSGLTTTDAGTISEALRSAKIPFEITDAGTTILVPATDVSQAVVAAGSAGYNGGGANGFEIFDKQQFGASEFDQQVAYQRAIEGKLQKTIESMAGVAQAQVSVVAAQSGLFADQDRPATASINIRMKNGLPDAALVQGIVSTVSGSVAGLTAENVTVVDASGRVLAGPDNVAGNDSAAIQSSVERGLSAKIQVLVDQALGAGHSSIALSAQLDLDKVEKTVTTIAPINDQNYTPTSVQTQNETYGGAGGTGGGGIPGAGSNVPGLPTYPGNLPTYPGNLPTASGAPGASTAPTASAAPGAGYVRTQETVNYANSQTIEKIVQQPGAIKRLSVAVLIDEAAAKGVAPENLKAAISAAIGADATRGDVVTVSAVPFAAATAATPDAGSGIADTVGNVGGTIAGALLAVVLLFLVWRNLRALRHRADEMQLVHAGPAGQGLLEPGSSYTANGSSASIAPLPEYDDTPQAKIQERLRIVADEKPEEIVGLVNSWLRTDGKSNR